MAEEQGISKNTVNRLWQLHHLKPYIPHISPAISTEFIS